MKKGNITQFAKEDREILMACESALVKGFKARCTNSLIVAGSFWFADQVFKPFERNIADLRISPLLQAVAAPLQGPLHEISFLLQFNL